MGAIGNAYRVRATKVYPSTQKALGRVGSVLREGYMEAMQEEIYDRTPLPVTRRLYNSAIIQFLGRTVQVSNSLVRCRYAVYRRRMTGISKLGGHVLDTQWEKTAGQRKSQQIRFIMRGALQEILGSGRNRNSFGE